MPNKACPTCKKESHVRTAKCVCGHVFYTPSKKAKEEVKEIAAVMPSDDEIEALKFKKQGNEIYKTVGNTKYRAVVNPQGKIIGVVSF